MQTDIPLHEPPFHQAKGVKMTIEWQDDLTTGIELIDVQHKEIFAKFTAFSEACLVGADPADLTKLMEY